MKSWILRYDGGVYHEESLEVHHHASKTSNESRSSLKMRRFFKHLKSMFFTVALVLSASVRGVVSSYCYRIHYARNPHSNLREVDRQQVRCLARRPCGICLPLCNAAALLCRTLQSSNYIALVLWPSSSPVSAGSCEVHHCHREFLSLYLTPMRPFFWTYSYFWTRHRVLREQYRQEQAVAESVWRAL